MSPPLTAYVRVSRKGDREDDRFHSPREQEARARAHAAAKGLAVGEVIEDIDVSGGTDPRKRPGMARALELIRTGQSGGLVAFSLDRLSRDPGHGDWLVREVTRHGGVIATPDMPDDITSPTGEFTFGMLLQVAKLYRSQAGARFASAKERSILAGIPVSRVPVGYRQREDRTLEPDPETAPAVRAVFERRAQGAGWTEVAERLSAATGHTWTLPGARGVLANRLYATGRLEYGDVVSEVDAGALVDEPLWHAAQQNEGPRPKREKESPWLLPGLARCASCGYALATWTGAKTRINTAGQRVPVKNRARRYRCRNRKCAEQTNAEATRLERYVLLRTFALQDELAFRSEAPDVSALEDAVAAAERRLAQVLTDEARDALGDLWASDVKAKRQARDDALARLGDALHAGGPGADFRLADVWDDLAGADDRRRALSVFWKAIYVGRRGDEGVPLRFVAQRPGLEVEVTVAEDATAATTAG